MYLRESSQSKAVFFNVCLTEQNFKHSFIIDKKDQSDRIKQDRDIQSFYHIVIYETSCRKQKTLSYSL